MDILTVAGCCANKDTPERTSAMVTRQSDFMGSRMEIRLHLIRRKPAKGDDIKTTTKGLIGDTK